MSPKSSPVWGALLVSLEHLRALCPAVHLVVELHAAPFGIKGGSAGGGLIR
jgi:hypothetical protein